MKNILILKQNLDIINEFDDSLIFKPRTKNTGVISLTKAKFERLLKWLKFEKNIHPYAFMAW